MLSPPSVLTPSVPNRGDRLPTRQDPASTNFGMVFGMEHLRVQAGSFSHRHLEDVVGGHCQVRFVGIPRVGSSRYSRSRIRFLPFGSTIHTVESPQISMFQPDGRSSVFILMAGIEVSSDQATSVFYPPGKSLFGWVFVY